MSGGVVGKRTIGGWRESFKRWADEGGITLARSDCFELADLLEKLSSERCGDAQRIITLSAALESMLTDGDNPTIRPQIQAAARDALKP